MRKKMTARQRLDAAIDRVIARGGQRPEDERHLAELYALMVQQQAQCERFAGHERSVRQRLDVRHIAELATLEAKYSALNRAIAKANYRKSLRRRD